MRAGEALDRRRRVHVGDRDRDVGDARVGQDVPGLDDLLVVGHVGHRAAGGEVGQDTCWCGRGQDVGRLGHEVHAAEDDVVGLRPGGRLAGELERVAGHVGELDDLVALVVVAEDEDALAERRLGRAARVDQVGIGGRGQLAGAVDAALGGRIAAPAQQQQRQRASRQVR